MWASICIIDLGAEMVGAGLLGTTLFWGKKRLHLTNSYNTGLCVYRVRLSLKKIQTQIQGPEDRTWQWLQCLFPGAEYTLVSSPHKYQSGRCPQVTGH